MLFDNLVFIVEGKVACFWFKV